jgi:hypothetical protein
MKRVLLLCLIGMAESVNAVGGKASYELGDVLVIGEGTTADVTKSTEPYSILVAGIYSKKPGLVGRRRTGEGRDAEIPMAMVGFVPTKVSAESRPIKAICSSPPPSQARPKGTDLSRMLGAVVGKEIWTPVQEWLRFGFTSIASYASKIAPYPVAISHIFRDYSSNIAAF